LKSCGKEENEMEVIEILNSPWAITPEKLLEIRAIYASRMRGEIPDLEAIEARLGRPMKNEREPYTIEGSTAIIPIEGVLAKKANLFTDVSGGTSMQMIEKDFQAAMADPAVKAIILSIDSPGGQVDGVESLANAIFAARGKKPIVALGDGSLASAAYWIASSADQVYASDQSAKIGSIGVVATHEDYSQAEHAAGVKVTEITAGKYKRIASSHEPLTTDGRESIQSMVDTIYSTFVDSVARNRGVNSQRVLDDMADGRIFLGKQAVNAGLVDGIATQESLVRMLNNGDFAKITSLKAEASAKKSAVSPIDVARRARELQADAAKRGTTMTNEQSSRLACLELGVPI
jgi:signal peptide peptidase SppA